MLSFEIGMSTCFCVATDPSDVGDGTGDGAGDGAGDGVGDA